MIRGYFWTMRITIAPDLGQHSSWHNFQSFMGTSNKMLRIETKNSYENSEAEKGCLTQKYAPPDDARSAYKSDGRIHFLPELIAGARFITVADPALSFPLYLVLSAGRGALSPSLPLSPPSVVNGDDVKNDTVFVAPFSIRAGPAKSLSSNTNTKASRSFTCCGRTVGLRLNLADST